LSKIILAKRKSTIFLSTLIVLGTLATILPSVQAAPYFEDRYNSDYQSYENRDYKSKDNNVILNKIKCNNINSNNNGLEAGLGLPNSVNPIVEAQAENGDQPTTAAANNWGNGERNNNDSDFRFVCINNNDNENNVIAVNETEGQQPVQPEPEPTTGVQLTINRVGCGENTIHVDTTVSNIEHGSEQLVFLIAWTAADGDLIFNNGITVIANAPNPATTFVNLNQNVEPGEYFIHAIVGGDVASESFTVLSCQ
jgi:hypothetical protein